MKSNNTIISPPAGTFTKAGPEDLPAAADSEKEAGRPGKFLAGEERRRRSQNILKITTRALWLERRPSAA